MAEPLALVLALNTMIPLCALLAFGASVSRSSWVVKAVSRTVLLALITLAWLSQPVSKIQNLVLQLWGHDICPVVAPPAPWWETPLTAVATYGLGTLTAPILRIKTSSSWFSLLFQPLQALLGLGATYLSGWVWNQAQEVLRVLFSDKDEMLEEFKHGGFAWYS